MRVTPLMRVVLDAFPVEETPLWGAMTEEEREKCTGTIAVFYKDEHHLLWKKEDFVATYTEVQEEA